MPCWWPAASGRRWVALLRWARPVVFPKVINNNKLSVPVSRYASLYFCCAIEHQDNELITLEIIHRYVELLDKYFGSVRVPAPPSSPVEPAL